VQHFERRTEALAGKAMMVCMSRRICVAMYNALAALRPGGTTTRDEAGAMKVVMTGAASLELHFQDHIRSSARREALATASATPRTRCAWSSCATCG
jgi:type I restriction enzyme R subunit